VYSCRPVYLCLHVHIAKYLSGLYLCTLHATDIRKFIPAMFCHYDRLREIKVGELNIRLLIILVEDSPA
jgi:hypothetical protein